jgi:hypothetical protein
MRGGLTGAAMLVAGMVAATLPARAEVLACPAAVTVIERTDAPQGWEATPGKSERRLVDFQVFRGALGEKRDPVKPASRQRRADGAQVTTWKFASSASRPGPYFVSCIYQGTQVGVLHEVPTGMDRCDLVATPGAKGRATAVCRSPG